MENFKVEYLITVDQKEPFCGSIDSFNCLLRAIDSTTITKNVINYRSININYEVQMGTLSVDEHRYFHVKLICGGEDTLIEFESFLKAVRGILNKTSGKPPHILWDDIGFYYAQKAYPLIFEIENILRKLITKFMLINVGFSWTDESVPKEVIESIKTKIPKNTQNYLYESDFIQLSNFLFKEYASLSSNALIDKVRSAQKIDDISLDEIKSIVPLSNWQRYFYAIVSCESDYLRTRWDKLYNKRNQIAHNKSLSRIEYEGIIQLIGEIKPKLDEALSKLDQVNVPEEDRESVAENAAENKNALLGEFFQLWKYLTSELYNLSIRYHRDDLEKINKHRYSIRYIVESLPKTRKYEELKYGVIELNYIRNILIHEIDTDISDEKIRSDIDKINVFRRYISSEIERIDKTGLEQDTDSNQANSLGSV